jgi:predicted acetyltransferase
MPGTVLTRPATEAERPVIENLLQLYLYDMTGDLPFPVGKDGRFAYDFLDRFWRFPYLVHHDGELAGFALVTDVCPVTGTDPCFFMAEFFVLKAYRRRGLGRAVFHEITARHQGRWHVGVVERNHRAEAFWAKTLAPLSPTISTLHFDGEDWRLCAFDVRNG